jgi:hypothetical protein
MVVEAAEVAEAEAEAVEEAAALMLLRQCKPAPIKQWSGQSPPLS